jgi:hypothetical protein
MTIRAPLLLVLLAVAAGAACSRDDTIVPVRNLERPSDMGFVCLGLVDANGAKVVSGRPMIACHDTDPLVQDNRVDLKNRNVGTFGLVTNTARGEVAVIDMDESPGARLVDLDTGNPGYNQVPAGALPEAIAASQDGCWAVTANRGTCDFAVMDPARMLASRFVGVAPSTGAGPVVRTVRARTPRGELRVAPYEIAFLPLAKEQVAPDAAVCQPSTEAGGPSARALVTFPACDLVALVDFPSGNVVSSVRILPGGGTQLLGNDPVCPDACGAAAVSSAGSAADAGGAPAPDGGAVAGALGTLGVGALAVAPEGTRAYVGASGSDILTALDITPAGLQIPASGGRIPLHDDARGVTRVRLSVDPFRRTTAGTVGSFIGNSGEFLYAFARDGSVRVIDVAPRRAADGRERECDANVDFTATSDGSIQSSRSCFELPDTGPSPWPRKPLAQGPGLRIPVTGAPDVAPPFARDIAFARVGAFDLGFLVGSNGSVYQVATSQAISQDSDRPHSFRAVPPRTTSSSTGGPALVVGEPDRSFVNTEVPFATKITLPSRFAGPRLEALPADGYSEVTFTDPLRAMPQDWTISWEQALAGTDRTTGQLSAGGTAGGTVTLTDVGADFCREGVEPGDIVALVGCNADIDCEPLGLATVTPTMSCVRLNPLSPGLCFTKAEAKDAVLLQTCTRHLGSRRRYEVVEAVRGQLSLRLKLDEVPKPALRPCQTAADCRPDAAHEPNATLGSLGFECLQVNPGEQMRCVQRCESKGNDRGCRPGHVCEEVGTPDRPLTACVEAPPPEARCWPRSVRYQVHAGRSFVVAGGAMPRFETQLEQGPVGPLGGRCVLDATRHPLLSQRIPLSAPHCNNVGDGADATAAARGHRPAADAPSWGNPCLFFGLNGDETATAGVTPVEHVKALFENPEIRFVLTNLEQYVGDGAVISFSVSNGFTPLRVLSTGEAGFSLGVRIVAGPMDAATLRNELSADLNFPPYIFVVDQSRTTAFGSRGQVLRINPRPTTSYPGGRIDSNITNSTFPIQ